MDYLLPETSKFAPSSTVLPLSSPYGGSAEGDGGVEISSFTRQTGNPSDARCFKLKRHHNHPINAFFLRRIT